MTKEKFLIFLLKEYKDKGHLYEAINILLDEGYSEDTVRSLYREARSRNWIINKSNRDDICCPFDFTEEGKHQAITIYDESNKNIFLKFNDFIKKYKYIFSSTFTILGYLLGKYGETIWNYLFN